MGWLGAGTAPKSPSRDSDCRIMVLDLSSNCLSGETPTEVVNFEELRHLLFFSSNLRGQIPTEVGQLANLSNEMLLSSSSLNDQIPAD